MAWRKRVYFVYIMSNVSRTLYTGVTGNLPERVWRHRTAPRTSFTGRYHITRLVYWEAFAEVRLAIAREKEIKGWLRARKVALVDSSNPAWQDLAAQPGFFPSI
jgi:putative endonuclease